MKKFIIGSLIFVALALTSCNTTTKTNDSVVTDSDTCVQTIDEADTLDINCTCDE